MNRTAWQAHAQQRQAIEPARLSVPPESMYWTQAPGVGPGAEILGDLVGRRVAELGCGAGHHLAHLVAHGAIGTGVDAAPTQIERAEARYGHLPGITFTTEDANDLLLRIVAGFDICYSVFGAIGLSPPGRLLSAIAVALRPGGLLAFSVPHPATPAADVLILPSGVRVPIRRWQPSTSEWLRLLGAAGLRVLDVYKLGERTEAMTLLITARTR